MIKPLAGTRFIFAVSAVTAVLLIYLAISKPKLEVEIKEKEATPVASSRDAVITIARRTPKSLLPQPPKTRLLATKTETKNGVRQTVEKLETSLTPGELQLYYTDRLLKDWLIERDDLTAGVGWSGLFSQLEPKLVRIAIVSLVSRLAVDPANAGPTRITIIKIEEVK